MKRGWLKVCCIANRDEARLALRCGADAIGLVTEMPSGPGEIPIETIASIIADLPSSTETVLLTSRVSVPAICEQIDRTGASTVQICDRIEEGSLDELRAALPGTRILQVLHVEDESVVARAQQLESQVDALLLDSGRPGAARKELGGTGRTHDWEISRRVVESVPCPVVLAGGLRPSNVEAAVRTVRPWGVDVCSGVRRKGALDEARVTRFLHHARTELEKLSSS